MALGGLGLALGCVVLIEALEARDPPAMRMAAGPAAPRLDSASPNQPDHAGAWVSAILDRPLFSRSRRPPPRSAVANGTRTGLPRLSGIMIDPREKLAIFAPTGGKPIVAREGGHIGAFTVRAIHAEEVTISGPNGEEFLHTAFSGATDGAGPDRRPAPTPPGAPVGPTQSLFGIPRVTKTAGGITLDQGKPNLPNAATWPGPPGLSSLPAPQHLPPASTPLLHRAPHPAPAGKAPPG